jgi:putative nucleotidyltransferase with HDIG domain
MLKRINGFIATADFLPPSFHLLPKLLLLLDDIESSADSLADLIRVDPGLTADILRVCNSAAYASSQHAETIREAILRLGFQEVHRIIMMVIASSALKDPQTAYAVRQADLWNHSLASAVSSQVLVKNTGTDPDIAFTSALLHDIGKVVLSNVIPEEFSSAVAQAAERNLPLHEVEKTEFKINHAEAGARLLERWGFPASICTAVQFHHDPAAAKDHTRLASCVCLSNVLSYRVLEQFILPQYVVFPDSFALRELGYNQPDFEALAPEARKQFAIVESNFR